MPKIVSISLGANMGNPTRKLRETINELNRLDTTKVFSISGLYHTAPVGARGTTSLYQCRAAVENPATPLFAIG